jgi:1-deoxy-D-xylulose-5-phosphate synthase
VLPVNPVIGELAATSRLVVTVEDNNRTGGVGSAVTELLNDLRITTPVRVFGLAADFLDAGKRAELLTGQGLTAAHLAEQVRFALAETSATTMTKVVG